MNEHKILNIALEKFKTLTEIDYNIVERDKRIDRGEIDTILDINVNQKTIRFEAEVKNEIRTAMLPKMISRFQQHQFEHPLLISQYIPKPAKEELRKRKINYLEASGNSYIQAGGLFILINDQPVNHVRTTTEGKLWTPAGIKFLYSILDNPEIINRSYRQISELTGVALGTIGGFIAELQQEGYLKTKTTGNKETKFLIEKHKLTDKWATIYRTVLKPKIGKGTYRFMDPKQMKDWKAIPTQGFKWGAENAGAMLTAYLTPEKYTIYTPKTGMELMRQLRLVPANNGPIEIIDQFWPDQYNLTNHVSPLLAYADLITSFDSRCQETAHRIKKQYLED